MWKPSCKSVYEHHDNNFVFKLTTGVPGGCFGDDEILPGVFKFKERCETRSHKLEIGKYIWSADVEMLSDELLHAETFYFFQIHDGRKGRGKGSPANLCVKQGQICLCDFHHTGFSFENNII